VDAYSPVSNLWTIVASLPTAGSSLPLGLGLDGRIVESELGVAYNIGSNTCTAIAASPSRSVQPAGVAGIDGSIYSIGGSSGTTYSSSVYDYAAVGPDTGSVATTVNVAPAISGRAVYATFTLGQASGSITLATFTDATPSVAADYTATINWGDGGATPDTSTGIVTLSDGVYTVTGSHTYANHGEFPVIVSVQESVTGNDSVEVSSDDPVAGAALTVTGIPFSPVRGAAITNLELATFVAAGSVVGLASNYTAMVAWGDGQTSSGLITADKSVADEFDVTANKPTAYGTAGAYSVVVPVSDGGGNPQASNTWATIAPVPIARDFMASAVDAEGNIYAIGGSTGTTAVVTVVNRYNPATNVWSAVAPLATARQGIAAATGANGLIYAIGGINASGANVSEVDAYNPANNTWATVASLPDARSGVTAVAGPDGLIYAIGGVLGSAVTKEIDAYDPATNTWNVVASMPTARSGAAASVGPDGRIYVVGGSNGIADLGTVEAYDVATQSWASVAGLPSVRDNLSAETGPDGRIYAIGGDNGTAAVSVTDAYNTSTNALAAVTSLPTATQAAAAAVGLNGFIYAIGGDTSGGITSVGSSYAAVGPDVAATTLSITVPVETPTISWHSPAAITYGTVLGAPQLDATATVPGTFVYTPAAGLPLLPAGTGETLSVTFTPTDTINYSSVTTTTTINVLQATPTITWATPANITYGTILTSLQLDASASSLLNGVATTTAGSFAYPDAGIELGAGNNQTLSVTFTPSDALDFTTATATVLINVFKATPSITWANAASITYGTALGGTQLDATSVVPGTFAYSPASGTVLSVGNGQTLSSIFTPTDAADYFTLITKVQISVTQATPPVTWVNPGNITYGTALGAAQLDATASVPGTFAYSPGTLTILPVGQAEPLSVIFYPTDSTDYQLATADTTINVGVAPLFVVVRNETRYVGQANPRLTVTYSGFVNGDTAATLTTAPVLTTPAGPSSPAGTYPILVDSVSSSDYAIQVINGTLTVSPALVTVQKVSVEILLTGKYLKTKTKVIVVQFSGGVNAASALNLGAYGLDAVVPFNKHKTKLQALKLAAAYYNSSTNSGTLTLRKALSLSQALQITVNGDLVFDLFGRPIDGAGDGQSGSSYVESKKFPVS
jgi:N-acetylneuraminic acid mutarotase